jgi:hypothetical protein
MSLGEVVSVYVPLRYPKLSVRLDVTSVGLHQAMTNPIAQRPGLVKCDQIYIRASKFSDKNTICIRGLVTFSIPNFGLVHLKIICQALNC